MTAPLIIDSVRNGFVRCAYYKVRFSTIGDEFLYIPSRYKINFYYSRFSPANHYVETILCYPYEGQRFDTVELIEDVFNEFDSDIIDSLVSEIIIGNISLADNFFSPYPKEPGNVFRIDVDLLRKKIEDPEEEVENLILEFSEDETIAFRKWEVEVNRQASELSETFPDRVLKRNDNLGLNLV